MLAIGKQRQKYNDPALARVLGFREN